MGHQGTSTFSRRAVLGTLATGAAFLAAPPTLRAQRLQWIGATATPAADFIGVSLDFFARRVAELTKDQIVISSHHGGSLGGEREHVEALLQGAVQVATPGQGVLAGWYRPAEVWTHPYLFKDVAHKDRVWDTMRGEYQADAAKEAKLRPLGAIPRMPRQLSCNRVVRAPADMKGLKIRVPETALWRRTFEMFGASPTPLPFPEVFQALKSGVIDGQENPTALTFNSGIFDANTHLSLTEHMMQDNCMLVGEVAYQRLTPELRAALDRAARDMEAELRPKVIADDAAVMQQVRAKKIVVSEVDKAAFSATVKTLVTEFPAGKKWVERIAQIA
ncbi:MAG: TRAP transporter substrate-binding protein [Phreatobacter sp.]